MTYLDVTLENWVMYGTSVVGRVFGHPEIPNGMPMYSGYVIPQRTDIANCYAECLSKHKDVILRCKLMNQGKPEDYDGVDFRYKPGDRPVA